MAGDEFLDDLLSNDASLDDGAIPDIKVIDSGINMSGSEVKGLSFLQTLQKCYGQTIFFFFFWNESVLQKSQKVNTPLLRRK